MINKMTYKEYLVVPESYRLANGEWNPKVVLRRSDGSSETESPLIWRELKATEEEANDYALKLAKIYIDKLEE